MNRCETWCGNASKPRAKTIDLCNNPLTKEPKLNQAARIIGARWTTYDERSNAIAESDWNATAVPAAGAAGAAAEGGGDGKAKSRDEL